MGIRRELLLAWPLLRNLVLEDLFCFLCTVTTSKEGVEALSWGICLIITGIILLLNRFHVFILDGVLIPDEVLLLEH